MKKTIILASAVTLMACGGNKNQQTEVTANADSVKVEAPTVNNILDPRTADLLKPITAEQLSQSMMACYNKEIQLVIYPVPYFDPEKFSQDQAATGVADSKEKTMQINFKTVPDVEYTKNKAFVIKCKIKEISVWAKEKYISIIEAELVGEAKDTKTEAFSPADIKAGVVYQSKDVVESIFGWGGKQITVIGDLQSITTSKDGKGKATEIRADIKDKSGSYIVGCTFDEDPSASLPAGTVDAKISGIVSPEMHYDRPYMTKCSVVK